MFNYNKNRNRLLKLYAYKKKNRLTEFIWRLITYIC